MIDFHKLADDYYASLSPAKRERVDAYHAAEARYNETAEQIEASFEVLCWDSAKKKTIVTRAYSRPVTVRIEDYKGGNGASEIVRFKGAVTGHEAYTIDRQLVQMLETPDGHSRFYICAGRPGDYEACSIAPGALAAYLRRHRPHLFEPMADQKPIPGR